MPNLENYYDPEKAQGADLPIGEFPSTIMDAKDAISKAGNNQIVLTIQPEERQWASVRAYLTFTDGCMPMIKEFLDALGGFDTGKGQLIVANELVGRRIRIVTKDDGEYNGRKRVRITRWLPFAQKGDGHDPADDIPMEFELPPEEKLRGKSTPSKDAKDDPF